MNLMIIFIDSLDINNFAPLSLENVHKTQQQQWSKFWTIFQIDDSLIYQIKSGFLDFFRPLNRSIEL